LGKNPEDYPDAKGQPHVQVGLRLKARGGTAKAGDVIPYVFCKEEGEESAKTAQADRARHPDEVRRSNLQVGMSNPSIIEELKAQRHAIDFEYYLSQQVLPPIERLCDPIEGTDRSRLAECLGRRSKPLS
jgi:DNA polymerase alpha subunit A